MTFQNRVLIDINSKNMDTNNSFSHNSNKLLFSVLSNSQKFIVDGFIYGNEELFFNRLDSLVSQASFIAGFNKKHDSTSYPWFLKVLDKLNPKLQKFVLYKFFSKKRFIVQKMQDEFGKDIIWRKFFHSLLSVKHRENIFRCNFFLSSAGLKSFQNATMRGNYRLSLDTNTHNFVIFDCLTGAKLSTNTKKIIKLDDLSLLKHPDLLDDPKAAKMFLKSFKNCSKDSFFVCPSPVVANDLIKLDPSISTRVFIIPNVIPSIARIKPTVELLKNVITKSISLSIFSKYGGLRLKTNDFISCWFSEKIQIPKFIVCFSNLESKKNINTLVDAWSRLRLETKSDVKLLIFGNKINQIKEDKTHKEIEQQQLCDSALKCIKPYIISKDLIYLENVGNSDIALLYSAASCYVAPSFSETLCSAPLEALSCGCPAVVSDNPSNRFLLENAALYCDPYDEEDIANKIKSVLSNENDTNLEQRFNHDWLKIQEKFSSKTILDCWEKFFEAISPL